MATRHSNPNDSRDGVSISQAELFDRLYPMLEAVYQEMSELSKKKQDGVLNAFKIRHINRILDGFDSILDADEPSRTYLERLDEETIPQNSDAVLLLAQWRMALQRFRESHSAYEPGRGKSWVLT